MLVQECGERPSYELCLRKICSRESTSREVPVGLSTDATTNHYILRLCGVKKKGARRSGSQSLLCSLAVALSSR